MADNNQTPQDFQSWLANARDKASAGGMSQDDADRAIANYLVNKGGWSQDQVLQAFTPQPPAQPPSRPGPIDQLKQAWQASMSGQDPKALMRYPFEAMMGGPNREGGLYDVLQPLRDAYTAAKQGQGWQAAGDVVSGLGPAAVGGMLGGPAGAAWGLTAGPEMQRGAQQLAQGNVLSGIGNVAGAEFQTSPEAVLKGVLSPTDPAAAGLFRRAMKFPRSMSPQEMEAASKLGLEQTGIGGASKAIDQLGHVDDPKSFLGGLENKAESIIQSKVNQAGQPIKIHWQTVRQPLMDEIATARLDKTTRGKQYLQGLLEELDNFDKEHPGGDMTLPEAQMEKRAIYRRTSPNVYSDAVQAPTPAQAEGSRLLAKGLKQSIEDVAPELKGVNDQMHNAILLQNRLIDIEKTHPGTIQKWLAPTIGMGGGMLGASMGHPYAGSLWATGLIGAQAISDPIAGANLARALHGLGYGRAAKLAGASGRAAGLGMFGGTPYHGVQVNTPDAGLRERLFGGQDFDVPGEIRQVATSQGVPPELAVALARQESGFKQRDAKGNILAGHNAQGQDRGARGIMQLTPATAAELGVDPSDPHENIEGGIRYLRRLLSDFHGDTRKALAAYNAGEDRINKSQSEADWPPETQDYVKAIMSNLHQ